MQFLWGAVHASLYEFIRNVNVLVAWSFVHVTAVIFRTQRAMMIADLATTLLTNERRAVAWNLPRIIVDAIILQRSQQTIEHNVVCLCLWQVHFLIRFFRQQSLLSFSLAIDRGRPPGRRVVLSVFFEDHVRRGSVHVHFPLVVWSRARLAKSTRVRRICRLFRRLVEVWRRPHHIYLRHIRLDVFVEVKICLRSTLGAARMRVQCLLSLVITCHRSSRLRRVFGQQFVDAGRSYLLDGAPSVIRVKR